MTLRANGTQTLDPPSGYRADYFHRGHFLNLSHRSWRDYFSWAAKAQSGIGTVVLRDRCLLARDGRCTYVQLGVSFLLLLGSALLVRRCAKPLAPFSSPKTAGKGGDFPIPIFAGSFSVTFGLLSALSPWVGLGLGNFIYILPSSRCSHGIPGRSIPKRLALVWSELEWVAMLPHRSRPVLLIRPSLTTVGTNNVFASPSFDWSGHVCLTRPD